MNINTNTLFNTLSHKIEPAMKVKIEKLSVDGKVNVNLLLKDKGIQSLLFELFKDISTGTKNKSEVLSILENSKSTLTFKNIVNDIKQILNSLKVELPQNIQLEKLTTLLKDTLIDIKNFDQKVLKSSIENSGIFLESKLLGKSNSINNQEILKNNIGISKNISSDMKTILLQIKEQIASPIQQDQLSKDLKNTIDKVLSQIDYYQLSSFSSHSTHSFLSFLQEDLEDVDIKIKQEKEDFSCLINLSLKENGELKILLQLDTHKNLHIDIGVEKKSFKVLLQNELQALRKQINTIGVSLASLNLFDIKDEQSKSSELKAYETNQNLNFGLDIKV